jgi:cytochrome c553
MKSIFVILSFFLLFSCSEELKKVEVEKEAVTKEKMVMYQPSEMANLMNEMYQANMKVKNQIKAGQLPEGFPEKFKNIHKAVLTDPTDRTDSFKVFSDNYLANLESVYKATEVKDAQERFNNTINACVACHQTTCTGPIPRIKKLLIK